MDLIRIDLDMYPWEGFAGPCLLLNPSAYTVYTQTTLRGPLPVSCPLQDCPSLVGNPLGPQSVEGMEQVAPLLSVAHRGPALILP